MTLNTSLLSNYQSEEVWLPFSESILEWDIDFHELMLGDRIRMVAYKNAIKEVVKPGMVVLDLGTGTGILGLWALQAGAKHLYAIDVNKDILAIASQNFEQNGFSGKFDVFHGMSYDINLPTRVDLIISEIMGNIADNEDFVPILTDAYNRFLKKSGIMLPSRVCSQLVPINSPKAHQQVQSKKVKRINANYSIEKLLQRLATKSPFDTYYDVIIPDTSYLSTPQVAKEFNMDGNDQAVYETTLNFTVEVDGIFTGFKGSFAASLSDSVTLDISGSDIASHTTSDSWKHCYLPVQTPVEVKHGDEIYLVFRRSYPQQRDSLFRQCYKWNGTIKRHGKIINAFYQSMES
ncbi:50S ribosomal protein L11 methyltransferase [Desmonostoc muscorum LEGE 12446]|uniref:50S ribosomal protein L11 methyltransferase n=1 Tax=Desmonostoc muscorum LEGE 12446 TaxID=1828758 RepID=A0A8J6ZJI5_DESMC|nr:50S ribosomal protein L11 methyltransferase [Desmonostoc muscorum]MCF2149644.1 50S ribosomal protein L11 methyltransferase [Desmonostoc muscorum LEGE 12446]